MLLFIGIAMLVTGFTLSVTRATIGEGLRTWIRDYTMEPHATKSSMLVRLTKCPFCFSFWTSIVAVIMFNRSILVSLESVSYVTEGLLILYHATVWYVSSALCAIMIRLMAFGESNG